MYIQWFGLSCFKIQTKEATILIDPFASKYGLKPPHSKTDILLISREEETHNNLKAGLGQPFVICSPGEYELKNVFIYGLTGLEEKTEKKAKNPLTLFLLETEGIKLAHLSDLSSVPSEQKLEKIEEADILFVPVGGNGTLNTKEASELIAKIEPRLVIPMFYKVDGLKLPLEGVGKFCREMGAKESAVQDRLKIAKKDLPQEETKVTILKI